MSLPPLPLINGCLFIDNSGWMEGMSTCHRYLEYKSLHLRIPAAEKPSLNFGSAQHLMAELRYVRYQSRPVDDLYFQDLASIFTEFFEAHPAQSEDWRNVNWAMEVARRYNSKYLTEDFNLLKYDTPIACPVCKGIGYIVKDKTDTKCPFCLGSAKREIMVELPFALPLFTYRGYMNEPQGEVIERTSDNRYLCDIPVFYTGRIDLPVVIDGNIYVMDHKNMSQLGDMFWNEQRMTSQQRGYVWAFQTLTGKPVHGYMINAIRTKEPPQYVSENTKKGKYTPESWWDESFQRQRFLIKPFELEEWKNNTIDLVEEFFWHYSRGCMPMKTKWCSSYGKCPYFDVCLLDSRDRGQMLASGLFTDNTWSPLNKTMSKQ